MWAVVLSLQIKKKPSTSGKPLSMGVGFVEFDSMESAKLVCGTENQLMKWRVRCACVLYLVGDVSRKQFKKLQTDLCRRGLQEGISSWQGHIDVGGGSPDWL